MMYKCRYCGKTIDTSCKSNKYIKIPKGPKSIYFCNEKEKELYYNPEANDKIAEELKELIPSIQKIIKDCPEKDIEMIFKSENTNDLKAYQIAMYIQNNLDYLINIVYKKEFTKPLYALRYINVIFQNNAENIKKLKKQTFEIREFDCDTFYDAISNQSIVISNNNKKRRRTISELEDL